MLSEEYDIISYGIDIRNNRFLLTVSDDDYDDLLLDEVLLEYQEVFLVETSGDDRPVDGKDAILTAGHNNEGVPNYYRSGNFIGKVAYQRCNTKTGDTSVNSLGDFAIITLNSSSNPTNYVRNSGSTVPITGTYSSLPVGTVI